MSQQADPEAMVLAELGAVNEVDLAPIGAPQIGPALARHRGLLRRRIAACTACGLREGCDAPVSFEGPLEPACVVVGEAPGAEEDRRGRPFVGASGKLLRGMLRVAGIEPDEVLFVNAACCRPEENRTPTDKELAACRENLVDQLELGPRYVLLVGGTALKTFRGDLKVSAVHGQVFVWMGKWVVMPIYHPAALLRTAGLKKITQADLEKWALIVQGEIEPLWGLGEKCVRCGDVVDHYDPDGVPFCATHWGRYGNGWAKERKKWASEPTAPASFFETA